jgi:hypothetical protein
MLGSGVGWRDVDLPLQEAFPVRIVSIGRRRQASGNFYAIFICAAVSCLSGKRNATPANLDQGLP